MDIDRFRQLVARLELESAAAPSWYRTKVAGLAVLGFGILAALLLTVGFGLFVLLALAVAVALTGGTALVLLLKFGKLLILLALPLWFLTRAAVRALFVRLPAPEGREITRTEAPALFNALDDMRRRMKGPRFHHVLVIDEVNAAVVQRPAFGLVGWPRNYLLLGLPLLEGMPASEALAVVAHEYGHLAGSHGRFSAFIYRLRHTWGTVQAYCDHIQGWLGRLVAPLVRWYAPYFNAYTFVLARADEYQADAAAAELVGAANAGHALKRVNVVGPRRERFMQQTFERIDIDAMPPRDVMHRWAGAVGEPPAEADARRWLADALDRVGNVTDTHPTLRQRLAALPGGVASLDDPPPALEGPSAAQAWFGPQLDAMRSEFQTRWAEQVTQAWGERHAEVQKQRHRLAELRAMPERDSDFELEMIRLTMRLETDADLRETLRAFNAAQRDHPLGLYLEGLVRLGKGEREGLVLLDRAMALDPEATKPACERAYAFLTERKDMEAAQSYAERWRRREELETQRAHQLANVGEQDTLEAVDLDGETLAAMKVRLDARALKHVAKAFVARRVIPADPSAVQFLLGVQLTWWARQRSKQQDVVDRLAAIEWPIPLVVLTLEGKFAGLKKKFGELPTARLA